MAHPSPDRALAARLQSTALAVVALGAIAATAIWGARAGGGVLGGALISALSYRSIEQAVFAIGPSSSKNPPRRPRSAARLALSLLGRHGLLLLGGYVIIVRLRLPPLAVLAGASAVVVAALVEAVRSSR